MITGTQEVVDKTKKELMTYFECEDCVEMREYVGNKLTPLEDRGLKFTQDMLIQKNKDEFDISDKKWSTPAAPGAVLGEVKEGEGSLSEKLQTYLRSGIGKMIHIMQWSRLEISHSVRNLANMIGNGNDTSIKALHRCVENCVGKPNRGVTLQPQGNLYGTKDYKFVINRRSDSDYAKDHGTRILVTGTRVISEWGYNPMAKRHAETRHSFCHGGRASSSCYVCARYDSPETYFGIHGTTGGIANDLGDR